MAANLTYVLQEGRGGEDWQDVDDYPRDASDLEAWIKIAKSQDTHGGTYQYRIVDSNGVPVWHQLSPYEGIRVQIYDPEPDRWLERIREDYGIDKALFAKACQSWLDKIGGGA